MSAPAALHTKPWKQGDSHFVPVHAPQPAELAPTSTQRREGRAMLVTNTTLGSFAPKVRAVLF